MFYKLINCHTLELNLELNQASRSIVCMTSAEALNCLIAPRGDFVMKTAVYTIPLALFLLLATTACRNEISPTVASPESEPTLNDTDLSSSNATHAQELLLAPPIDSWEGNYAFHEASVHHIWEYVLNIYKEGDALFATVYLDGWQTMQELHCRAQIKGNSLGYSFAVTRPA